MAHFYRPKCKCDDKAKCKCGATWGFLMDVGINPKTGKRKQKFKGGFAKKKDAEATYARMLLERENGMVIDESKMLFKDFAEQWLAEYSLRARVKESTVRVRTHESDRLISSLGNVILKSITKNMYQNALNDLKKSGGLKKSGLADNTLEGIHSTGRMIFKRAIELELLKADPSQGAYVPKTKKTVEELEAEQEIPKYLEKEELALFLHTAQGQGMERDYEIFRLLAYSGMRVGELCALKWSDLDFDTHQISITKTYYNPNNNPPKFKLGTPKTKSSKRKIYVDPEVFSDLEEQRKRQREYRMRHKATIYEGDFVFAKTGKHMGYPEYIKQIENRMRRLLKLAGLTQSLTPHSLRHTHTSLLAEARVPLEAIMERLGHSEDDVTKRIYLHVTKDIKKEASHKFGELMRGLR